MWVLKGFGTVHEVKRSCERIRKSGKDMSVVVGTMCDMVLTVVRKRSEMLRKNEDWYGVSHSSNRVSTGRTWVQTRA